MRETERASSTRRHSIPAVLLWLVLALGLLAPPAWAAPPVTPMPILKGADGYEAAARTLGCDRWWNGETAGRALRVYMLLDARLLILTVNRPSGVTAAQADQWLQGLADAMGWQDVELYSGPLPAPGWVQVRVRGVSRLTSPGRARVELDMEKLWALLQGLSRGPVRLAMRVSGVQIRSVPFPTLASGQVARRDYRFFQLGPGPAPVSRLRVEYGLSDRWQAAALAAFLTWLLFPAVVLVPVREWLRKSELDAKTRWKQYGKWTRGVIWAGMGSAVLLFVSLAAGHGAYVIGNGNQWLYYLIAPFFWLMGGSAAIGDPLLRDASERLRKRPRYVPWVALGFGSVMFLMLAFAWWFSNVPPAPPNAPLSPWLRLFLVTFLLGIVVFVLSTVIIPPLLYRRRRTGRLGPHESEAPAALREAVEALFRRLGYPVRRVLLARLGMVESPGPAVVFRDVVVFNQLRADRFSPEQLAALAAAEAGPRSRAEVLWEYGGLLFLVPFAGLAWEAATTSFNTWRPSSFQIGGFLGCILLGGVLAQAATHRAARRRKEADRRVAEAVDDPEVFLTALREVELITMERADLDPELTPVPERLTRRRTTLESALGLD